MVERKRQSPSPSLGFTVIEIILVLLIISLLASLVLPMFQRARQNAHALRAKRFLIDLSEASEAYAEKNGAYPMAIDYLTGATPPYLHINLCSQERNGYFFICMPTLVGYLHGASLMPDHTATFMIMTGGVKKFADQNGEADGWQ